jgi:hypothetical protein
MGRAYGAFVREYRGDERGGRGGGKVARGESRVARGRRKAEEGGHAEDQRTGGRQGKREKGTWMERMKTGGGVEGGVGTSIPLVFASCLSLVLWSSA